MNMKTLCETRDGGGRMLVRIYESEAAARSHAFRVHHHVECELSLILSGTGSYSASKSYTISEGDVFFYKNSEPHCITDIAEGGMRILNIHLSPQYFRQLSSFKREEAFGAEFLQMSFPSNKLSDFIPPEESEEIARLMRLVRRELTDRRDGFSLIVDAALSTLLVLLSRRALPRTDSRTRGASPSADLIFSSAAYIDLHFTEPLSLADLAAAVNLEKTYYSCLFKRMIGLSPWEYISIKRVERAITLLRSTDMNILDVAVSCGFNNTANFNKIFKKYAGSTPKSLRR